MFWAWVLTAQAADPPVTAAAFAPYVEGHQEEVSAQVSVVRHFLTLLRDRDLLLRAAHDPEGLRQLLGPIADLPEQERGQL